MNALPLGVILLVGATGVPEPWSTGANGAAAVELAIAGYSSSASVALGGASTGGQLQIEHAYLSVRDLRFRPADDCDQAGLATVVAGPILAELVERHITGFDGALSLPPTRYCGVDVRLHRADGGTGVPSLEDHTVVLRGRRADGVAFMIRSRRRDLIQLVARARNGFAVPARRRLFLAVDLGRWMDGIDLANLVPGRGRKGIIRIDERSHRELLRRFENNLAPGLSLCLDEDDDSIPSPRECSPERRLTAAR
jgi:hypothetical protein